MYCPTFTALKTTDDNRTALLLDSRYDRIKADENGYLRVYDAIQPEEIAAFLYRSGVTVTELTTQKIGLEEYYMNLMQENGGTQK